ncbi:MAG TPA: flavodoxin domain-containing protein [Anaerolineae bacterium]|nr:flavodoxin domain-containing protein [Anaerolineae bacterium]
MKIGLIVYSHTGHTLSVARKLKEKLSAAGHVVTLEQIETAGPVSPNATSVELKTVPAIDAYDALVFGSPVWGGVPAAPMMSYLGQITSLAGKKVACLVTGFFPAQWGRNRTIARMKEICESKGATVCGAGSVGWFRLNRKRQITDVVDHVSRLF